MKYKKLKEKLSKVLEKHNKGKSIDQSKIEKLKTKLEDKKSQYENRLKEDIDPKKRKTLELKLDVVNSHISKLAELK